MRFRAAGGLETATCAVAGSFIASVKYSRRLHQVIGKIIYLCLLTQLLEARQVYVSSYTYVVAGRSSLQNQKSRGDVNFRCHFESANATYAPRPIMPRPEANRCRRLNFALFFSLRSSGAAMNTTTRSAMVFRNTEIAPRTIN